MVQFSISLQANKHKCHTHANLFPLEYSSLTTLTSVISSLMTHLDFSERIFCNQFSLKIFLN